MIKRIYNLEKTIKQGKVLIIYGPRQVGKTTIIKEFIENTKLTYRYDTGDGFQIQNELSKCTYESTDNHVGNYDLIIIDEAQKIPNIGNALKLMVDRHPHKYFIATGSSSFDLANKTDESLTGRKIVIKLYPISILELSKTKAISEIKSSLETNLIFGSYPEVTMAKINDDKEQILHLLSDSYLIKDILEFDRIKRADVIIKLLKLLAFQIGSEVSANELGRSLGVDTKTILYYMDLLEKSFVIFSMSGYSGNLRKEITKMSKYYFYDNGIRNALISNFNKIEDRNDLGQLWENFLMIERRKRNEYKKSFPSYYFWRTYSKQEIDLIEEKNGLLSGFEFKWKNQKSVAPPDWTKSYKNSNYTEINQDNYFKFIT
jgi:uncharacterized protein